MANAFYVHVEGEKQGKIDGDCDQVGREKMIRGYVFQSMTTVPRHRDTGQPNGTRTHHPIVFTKHVDEASPLLWQAMSSGERLKTVRFDFYKTNALGKNENHYSVTLSDAIIVQMETELADTSNAIGTQAEEIREHLHLTFRRIEWQHKVAGKAAADDWRQV